MHKTLYFSRASSVDSRTHVLSLPGLSDYRWDTLGHTRQSIALKAGGSRLSSILSLTNLVGFSRMIIKEVFIQVTTCKKSAS
jgi:hypothetical protein